MFFKKAKEEPSEHDKQMELIKSIAKGQGEIVTEFMRQYGEEERYCTIHRGPCQTKGFFFWRKDALHRYQFANEMHCKVFFELPEDCKNQIFGLTDIDLVNSYRERTGRTHTFGDLCVGTDDVVMARKEPTRFIEIGYIGEVLFILDVQKTPYYNIDGVFTGSTGVALNIADHSTLVREMIEVGLKRKTLEVISIADRSATYLVKKCGVDAFLDGFPKEEKNG